MKKKMEKIGNSFEILSQEEFLMDFKDLFYRNAYRSALGES